jgi:hypothetical protein
MFYKNMYSFIKLYIKNENKLFFLKKLILNFYFIELEKNYI